MDGSESESKRGTYRERVGKIVGDGWWPDNWNIPVLWKTKDSIRGIDAAKGSPRADGFNRPGKR
jgi:hypothetical protein